MKIYYDFFYVHWFTETPLYIFTFFFSFHKGSMLNVKYRIHLHLLICTSLFLLTLRNQSPYNSPGKASQLQDGFFAGIQKCWDQTNSLFTLITMYKIGRQMFSYMWFANLPHSFCLLHELFWKLVLRKCNRIFCSSW